MFCQKRFGTSENSFSKDYNVDNRRRTIECLIPNTSAVKIHLDESRSSYTTRSLKDLKAAMPPFLSFDKYKNEENTRQILEIGCGTGHALVELQALLPNAKLTGTNKK